MNLTFLTHRTCIRNQSVQIETVPNTTPINPKITKPRSPVVQEHNLAQHVLDGDDCNQTQVSKGHYL